MNAVDRYVRRVREVDMTAAQLLALALDRGRFPAKRFRVEGSRCGSSELLTKFDAERSVICYGGTKVEIVTLEMYLRAQAKDLPACSRSTCKAAAGEPCKRNAPSGFGVASPSTYRNPHANRTAKPVPRSISAARSLPTCPEPHCRAKAGEPCTRAGRLRMPHPSRRPPKASTYMEALL